MDVNQFFDMVKNREKHFAAGDIVRPHLLTTAIGHGQYRCGGHVDKYS